MIETMTQFSIDMGTKPGLLATICRTLGSAKVNIVALTVMDSSNHGVLRLVAADADQARDALKDLNLTMKESKVMALTMPNRPGAVADVCERLSLNRVQISYMYQTTGAAGGKSIGIFKVANIDKAAKLLASRRPLGRDMKAKLRNNQRVAAGRH